MTKYPIEHWRTLGRYVQRQRLRIEPDMHEWAGKVGRSTRHLEGLERGEQVGSKTIILVADGLGVDPDFMFAILESGVVGAGSQQRFPASVSLEDRRYTGQVRLVIERVASWYLDVPDENRDHAVDLLIQFTRAHPIASDEGD